MTAEDYFALNQANAKRFPTMQPQRQTMDEFRANNRRVYGWDTTYGDAEKWAARDNKRQIWLKGVLPAAIFATGGAALGALGGGAAAGAGAGAGAAGTGASAGTGLTSSGLLASSVPAASMSTYAAPVVASGTGAAAGAGASTFSLGSLLNLAKVAAPVATNYLGQRSNNKALDRQSQMEQATLAEQMAFAREQEAFRRAEAERVAFEDRRRWEAEQVNQARQLAAAEEERAYQRRLLEEREGLRSQARMRLEDFLRRGR